MPYHLPTAGRVGVRRLTRARVGRTGLIAVLLTAVPRVWAAEDVSDAGLAALPVVVVAHVVPGPLETRKRFDTNALVDTEQRVTLEIERVLSGSATPGPATILLQDGLHIQEDGGPVWASELAEPGGEMLPDRILEGGIDVRASHLWFLERGRSCDPSDKATYLILRRARGVQRLELEPWFETLRAPDALRRVPAMLEHADPYVAAAALAHVAGGVMPWPDASDVVSSAGLERQAGPPLKGEVARVRRLLTGKVGILRMHAAGVLHLLEGPLSAPGLRKLLTDPDADVVVGAMGLLAQLRDVASLDALVSAAATVATRQERTDLGLDALARLADWDEPRLVPALIAFLDGPQMPGDSDWYWDPTTYAQELLFQRTGYGFPTQRVAACQAAWKEALGKTEKADRVALLTQRLGADHAPLAAVLRPEASRPDGYLLEVRNRGTHPLTVVRRPSAYVRDGGMMMGSMLPDRKGREAFVELKPGESIREPIKLPNRSLHGSPWDSSISLQYRDDGSAVGLKAWKGGVWVVLPPLTELVRSPSEAQRAEVTSALTKLLAAARARDDEAAASDLAMVDIHGYDDWGIPLGFHDPRQTRQARRIMGRLRVALEHGEPAVERIDVRGGEDGKREGPFLDVRVRFGTGPEAQVLSLRLRRVLGRVLLGIVQRY